MRKIIRTLIVALCVAPVIPAATVGEDPDVTLTIVYDNYAYDENFVRLGVGRVLTFSGVR